MNPFFQIFLFCLFYFTVLPTTCQAGGCFSVPCSTVESSSEFDAAGKPSLEPAPVEGPVMIESELPVLENGVESVQAVESEVLLSRIEPQESLNVGEPAILPDELVASLDQKTSVVKLSSSPLYLLKIINNKDGYLPSYSERDKYLRIRNLIRTGQVISCEDSETFNYLNKMKYKYNVAKSKAILYAFEYSARLARTIFLNSKTLPFLIPDLKNIVLSYSDDFIVPLDEDKLPIFDHWSPQKVYELVEKQVNRCVAIHSNFRSKIGLVRIENVKKPAPMIQASIEQMIQAVEEMKRLENERVQQEEKKQEEKNGQSDEPDVVGERYVWLDSVIEKAYAGDPEFQCRLAQIYSEGKLLLKDKKKARQFYEKAAEGGSADAQSWLNVENFKVNQLQKTKEL